MLKYYITMFGFVNMIALANMVHADDRKAVDNVPVYEGYELAWSDEFEVDGRPDPSKWTYERGFVRNHELQWYQPQNAYVEGGVLVIEGKRERKENPHYKPDSQGWKKKRKFAEYTSACVTTRGIAAWQYGRFEVRARIQAEAGLWPAIWFLGVEGQWPSKGEIDLMEFYQGKILANACWGTKRQWKAKWDASKTPLAEFVDPEFSDKFHVWRMDWDKQTIRLYLNDRLLNTIDVEKARNPTTKWGPKYPFRQPHYLLLNLAIGGHAGGDPSKTDFPTRYEIDHVRMYQKITDQNEMD